MANTTIAAVGFESYQSVLEHAQRLIPLDAQVRLLADRGFEHAAFVAWLEQQQWHWSIRVKSDLNVTLASGHTYPVESWVPPPEHAHLFEQVRVLGGVVCHLATANAPDAQDHWAVLSDQRTSLQTFYQLGIL
jgi:Transposase DDE domain